MLSSFIKNYVEKGYCVVPSFFSRSTIQSLRDAVNEILDASRRSQQSTDVFDLDDGHSETTPRLRKIKRPYLWHVAFKHVAFRHERMLDLVEKVMAGASSSEAAVREGRLPGLRFQGDKVVVKMPNGVGKPVIPHQDWAFYPHTNDDLCTVSIVLEDMTAKGGGLLFLPRSHRGPLYPHHNDSDAGTFVGGIPPNDQAIPEMTWDSVNCKAGSIIVHHSRIVHASLRNDADAMRPLLLLQYASTGAWPLQQHTRGAWGIDLAQKHRLDEWDLYAGMIVRGKPTTHPRMESVPVSLALPWPGRGTVGSLYRQLGEKANASSKKTARFTAANIRSADCTVGDGHELDVDIKQDVLHRPCSGIQFSTIREYHSLEWQRLLQFVGAGPYGSLDHHPRSRLMLQQALAQAVKTSTASTANGNDDDVFDELHECFHKEVVPLQVKDAFLPDRVDLRAAEVVKMIGRVYPALLDTKSAQILDFGCADGRITARVAELLRADPSRVHGCDDRSKMTVGAAKECAGFTFHQTQSDNTKLPFEDESLGVVYSLMTLHHVRHQHEILCEIRRVLKPGGLLLFREHDARTDATSMVFDLMHGLHHRVWSPKDHPNYRNRGWYRENYVAYYQSAREWNASAIAAGLAPLPLIRNLSHLCDDGATNAVDHRITREGAEPVLRDANGKNANGAFFTSDLDANQYLQGCGDPDKQNIRFSNMKCVFWGAYVK